MRRSNRRQWLDLAATAAAFRLSVVPQVRRELRGWREAAAKVPDPVLRRAAVDAVVAKAANSEATAVLATLAPRRTRAPVIRSATALQVAIDYLDCLGEEAVPDPLSDGLALHAALGAALSPDGNAGDWYTHHPHREDGGHLERLVVACREAAFTLPSAESILPLAHRAAVRCGEGQSYTHAAAGSPDEMRGWARQLPAPAGFEWWEVAAGASSSVAAHALLALAAGSGATAEEGERVDRAYFPGVGALTVLLDDLVDRESDRAADQHNYLDYYGSPAETARRIGAIAQATREILQPLGQGPRHLAILTGILAFYLGSAPATPAAQPVKDGLLASDPAARALIRIPGIAS